MNIKPENLKDALHPYAHPCALGAAGSLWYIG